MYLEKWRIFRNECNYWQAEQGKFGLTCAFRDWRSAVEYALEWVDFARGEGKYKRIT